jgi:mannose-1-phosphate guanylyltransferase/mannose-6-phosphate isomerase
MRLIPVILSGGSGSRLWPVSRALYPKQLLALVGDSTLLQQTAQRGNAVAPGSDLIVVCNQEHRFLVAEQLSEIGIQNSHILLEAVARNTAPAIALAAFHALQQDKQAMMLVLPSDHLVSDADDFSRAVAEAFPHAQEGALITFGAFPEKPATGYGYIKAAGEGISPVAKFTEKPDIKTAETFLKAGGYYWNSGMFMFKADVYLDELRQYAPAIYACCERAYAGITRDLDFLRIPPEAFETCPSLSIDYAVMEHTRNACVVPLAKGWSDLGSWLSLWEAGEKDLNNNVTIGDVVLYDASNSYIRADSRLVGVLGIHDHIIVETKDAVLVAHKDRAEDIKLLVEQLKADAREEVDLHKLVYRPWGSYESIDEASRYKVKRITVKPGASLSLQMHHHRAEHWIVVQGTAKVTCDDKQYIVSENQSTYIPLGAKHRLENPGTIPLELIEVQSGSYLGEDDIVRFDDKYGR